MQGLLRCLMLSGMLAFVGTWNSGCATTPRPEDLGSGELTQQELQLLLKKAHDPRRYGLTVFQSDHGPVYTRANRLHPGQVVTLEFLSKRSSSSPVIQVYGRKERTKYVALVDTSSRHSWIDLATMYAMNAVPLAPPAIGVPPTSVNSPVHGLVCTPDKLMFDVLHIETPLLWFQASRDNLGPLVRDQDPEEVRGVIGCDMLKAFQYVTFDFSNRLLTLSSSKRFSSDLTKLIGSVPFTFVDGRLTVEGGIEGKPSPFILDVAGSYSLALPEPLPASLKLLSMGDLVFQTPALVSSHQQDLGSPEIPRIGRDLLAHYRVTLDMGRKMVHFERP